MKCRGGGMLCAYLYIHLVDVPIYIVAAGEPPVAARRVHVSLIHYRPVINSLISSVELDGVCAVAFNAVYTYIAALGGRRTEFTDHWLLPVLYGWIYQNRQSDNRLVMNTI